MSSQHSTIEIYPQPYLFISFVDAWRGERLLPGVFLNCSLSLYLLFVCLCMCVWCYAHRCEDTGLCVCVEAKGGGKTSCLIPLYLLPFT